MYALKSSFSCRRPLGGSFLGITVDLVDEAHLTSATGFLQEKGSKIRQDNRLLKNSPETGNQQ
jgi:hypothetical protein